MAIEVRIGTEDPFEAAGVVPELSLPAHSGTCGSWFTYRFGSGSSARVHCQLMADHEGEHEATFAIRGEGTTRRWSRDESEGKDRGGSE